MSDQKTQIILDNRTAETSIGEYLRKQLGQDVKFFRIVSACFTVYAYKALKPQLEQIGAVHFLFGDPGSVGEIDPSEKQNKNFDLTEQGLLPKAILQQKHLARECAEWIKKKVKIRTIKQTNFLHGKMYHIEQHETASMAVLGSSNFTHRGLGFNEGANLEINLLINKTDTRDELKYWFDDVWKDKNLTRDAKKEVLDALERIGKNHSPELVYFKTLLEVFRERMETREDADTQLGAVNLRDTQIWKTLYQFQRDGVVGIINRLKQHHGCILADSVGLGKTYTALAVIRYYQAKNHRVMVLCPKKLSENWKLYPTQFGQKSNPFKKDDFRYLVLHHTDLSRFVGESNGIDLEKFDWDSFGLVVIDESHNFRNESSSERDHDGNIIRHSRYERLLQEMIQKGGQTDVLMLSATPVNTSLDDLRNQIYFMTGKRDNTFNESLGIRNMGTMLRAAQKQFKHWEEQRGEKDKRDLFDKLGGDFFTLLDAVSIARSRHHIKKFYPDVVKQIGGFPKQARPVNKMPPTDLRGELSYEILNEEIKNFGLSIYTPAAYVVSEQAKQKLADEKEKLNFNQADRERWLIGMVRVNFLKRLESAAPSLVLTLQRTIAKINSMISRIQAYQASKAVDSKATERPEDDADDEDFVVNKVRQPFHFRDLDLPKWLCDLNRDSSVLNGVLEKVQAINPARDGKLAELKYQVRNKLTNPTTDKDGRKNRKVLIFTTFKDTADYLYEELTPLLNELDANYSMVAGDAIKSTYGTNKFNDILRSFAPIGRGRFRRDENGVPIADGDPEIDVLIATDCVSEGQNLQDCDLVINYDIHWNPVRLIQRFGRIDRIGSRNREVKMINFWPVEDLDKYINLQSRVEARMALVDATATGDDQLMPGNLPQTDETHTDVETDINFRDVQMRRLYEGDLNLDFDEFNDSVNLSDFSLDDFIAQLMGYLEKNRAELENTPLGAYAVVDSDQPRQENIFSNVATPGIIFCLQHKNPQKKKQWQNVLKNYFLIYVRDTGEIRYNYTHAKQILELFGELSRGKTEPLLKLCDAFDSETEHGQNMEKYDKLLDKGFSAIKEKFDLLGAQNMTNRHGVLPKQSEKPRDATDFDLVTWLVIKGRL